MARWRRALAGGAALQDIEALRRRRLVDHQRWEQGDDVALRGDDQFRNALRLVPVPDGPGR